MKESPIIFGSEIVRAILTNHCTQTRRVIKPQPEPCNHLKVFGNKDPQGQKPTAFYEVTPGEWACIVCGKGIEQDPKSNNPFDYIAIKCPYGQVGGRLYIKETRYKYGFWMVDELAITGKQQTKKWGFQPLSSVVRYCDNPPEIICTDRNMTGWFKRPSLFMFKKDARIWLEITGVRVERLQEITEAGQKAEGIAVPVEWAVNGHKRTAFGNLWDSLNKSRGYGWDTNPWVWVIDYKRIKL